MKLRKPQSIEIELPEGGTVSVMFSGPKAFQFIQLAMAAVSARQGDEYPLKNIADAVDAILPDSLRGALDPADYVDIFKAGFEIVRPALMRDESKKKLTESAE